jgi:hypothetical protein
MSVATGIVFGSVVLRVAWNAWLVYRHRQTLARFRLAADSIRAELAKSRDIRLSDADASEIERLRVDLDDLERRAIDIQDRFTGTPEKIALRTLLLHSSYRSLFSRQATLRSIAGISRLGWVHLVAGSGFSPEPEEDPLSRLSNPKFAGPTVAPFSTESAVGAESSLQGFIPRFRESEPEQA